ncbi:hemolysin family protein [Tundrisphaera sp. TA3]|uniref:hemolysin family protein n=1 Tax=Tundrisphaera sp. TA3 TaxID=3435775 RepID=UPI003EBEE851
MRSLNLAWILGVGLPLLLAGQALAIAFGRALRTYSRSRLEEVCSAHGRPARADAIAHGDEVTERAAESLGILAGLTLASLLAHSVPEVWPALNGTVAFFCAIGLSSLTHILASVVGRVYAEPLLDALWPIARPVRLAARPMTGLGNLFGLIAARLSRPEDVAPRPASVEVEYPSDAEIDEEIDADIPSATRAMLEHVVALSLRDVSEIMTPRSSMILLPATTSAQAAARAFSESGLSRIPIFGENRDDIIGILFAKDLFPAMTEAASFDEVSARKLARGPYFIPETMPANDLLNEFRSRKVQIAIVLDEYGGVTGLITLEDLIEELVGPIDDEHDREPPDPVVALGEKCYEVPASIELETVNQRLGTHLPTGEDYETVGGLALNALGRLPSLGESFRSNGVEFTVIEVVDHAVRRLRLDLNVGARPSP